MSKVFNMVGGGGKNISSIIITGLTSTDTITCTKDGKTYPATWDDTSQHWEIVGLPLGTFTVTATNGTKTTTETVLIDITGVYEIEMSYKLWLYRYGDPCEDVTGGWTQMPDKTAATLLDDKIQLTTYSSGLCTAKKIDLTPYTKIWVDITHSGTNKDHPSVRINSNRSNEGAILTGVGYGDAPSRFTTYKDISELNDSYYVLCWEGGGGGNSGGYVHAVWLE